MSLALGLLFHSEDGDDIFLRKKRCTLSDLFGVVSNTEMLLFRVSENAGVIT
jgi:hypothetical protein